MLYVRIKSGDWDEDFLTEGKWYKVDDLSYDNFTIQDDNGCGNI